MKLTKKQRFEMWCKDHPKECQEMMTKEFDMPYKYKKHSKELLKVIKELRKANKNIKIIGQIVGLSHETIRRIIKNYGLKEKITRKKGGYRKNDKHD